MRIGLINELHGRPDGPEPAPTWRSVEERALTAERIGFDIFVFEDALLYRSEGGTDGVWESVSMAAALAATTTSIDIAHSVFNSPYRSPALVASIATTLDEISGGRYVLGIGAGNTPDSDYRAFGFPTDRRYSRFAEAIGIIHSLLKTGRADFAGEVHQVEESELVLRGPSPQGPPINIAAGGIKMLDLVAEYADEWNWWGWDESLDQLRERIGLVIENLKAACERKGRDPGTITRTFDLYSVLAPGLEADHGLDQPVSGSPEDIAAFILGMGELGIEEVRVDLWPRSIAAIEAMSSVVDLVHRS